MTQWGEGGRKRGKIIEWTNKLDGKGIEEWDKGTKEINKRNNVGKGWRYGRNFLRD